MTGKPRTAIVIGAGIGGLAAAIALTERGWDVTVLERESQLDASGAALAIWPNGTRALERLGLRELVQRLAARPISAVIRKADGKPMVEHQAQALRRRYGAPLVAVRREELLQAEHARLGQGTVLFDCPVTRVLDGTVEFGAGSVLAADLIVGADGLRSQARRWVSAGEEPRASGLVAFRGLTASGSTTGATTGATTGGGPAATTDTGAGTGSTTGTGTGTGEAMFGEWWGPGVIAGLIPLYDGRIYWYVSLRGDSLTELDDQLDAFAPSVRAVVRSTPPDQVLVHELFDRRPSGAWIRGRVALLGDAAHAMLPFLGQGACSSLEDAVALADALEHQSALQHQSALDLALAAYVRARRTAAARLIRGSRVAGDLAMLRSPAARAIRDLATTVLPASYQMRRLDPVLGRADRRRADG